MKPSTRELAKGPTTLKLLFANLQQRLPFLYLMYALPAILIFGIITPPFQVPDEPNHFKRAEQVSSGRLVTFFQSTATNKPPSVFTEKVLMPDSGGYTVNKGISLAASFYDHLPENKLSTLKKSSYDSSEEVGWNHGKELGDLPNTAIYPPTGYVMSAIGIVIGKLFHLSVINTLYLSRCLNGCLCAVLCFYAMRLVKSSRLPLFTVLLFPMTVALFASVSQDGILVSLACVFLAIIDSVETDAQKVYSRRSLITIGIAIVAIGAARPPYFMLSFLFFFLRLEKRTKASCFMATLVPVIFWAWLNRHNYTVAWAPPEMKINPPLQVKYILSDPLQFASLFFKPDYDYIKEIVFEFIGVLGWLDVELPEYYYLTAMVTLFLAVAVTAQPDYRKQWTLRLTALIVTFSSFIAILVAQYITWVELEAGYLGGVQGRYFIPLFIPVIFAVSGLGENVRIRRWQLPVFLLVLMLPFISVFVSISKLLARYY